MPIYRIIPRDQPSRLSKLGEDYLSLAQIDHIRQDLVSVGVTEAALDDTWDKRWEVSENKDTKVTRSYLLNVTWLGLQAQARPRLDKPDDSAVTVPGHILATTTPSSPSVNPSTTPPPSPLLAFSTPVPRRQSTLETLATSSRTPPAPVLSNPEPTSTLALPSPPPTSTTTATSGAPAQPLEPSRPPPRRSSPSRQLPKELEKLRDIYSSREGTATFFALDFETFEFKHDIILEAGWASVSTTRSGASSRTARTTKHVGASPMQSS